MGGQLGGQLGEPMAPAQERSSTPGPEGAETERVKMAALSPGAEQLLGKQACKTH